MTSMRVSDTPLIASSLIIGDEGLGVEGVNIPSTGQDGPSVLFQYVTLPTDNDNEFRMLVTSQPSVGTLTSFEDGSFIYAAPDLTVDSFNYTWFKDGVSQASDTVNLTIGVAGGFTLSPQVVNSSSVSLDPAFAFSSVFNLSPNTVNSSSISVDPAFVFNSVFNLSPATVNSSSIANDPSFTFSSAFTLTPNIVNSSSVSLDPLLTFTSVFTLNTQVVNSLSESIDPLFSFAGAFNLDPNVVNSTSISLNPMFSFGQIQVIGTVTASFAPDLYTAQFKS